MPSKLKAASLAIFIIFLSPFLPETSFADQDISETPIEIKIMGIDLESSGKPNLTLVPDPNNSVGAEIAEKHSNDKYEWIVKSQTATQRTYFWARINAEITSESERFQPLEFALRLSGSAQSMVFHTTEVTTARCNNVRSLYDLNTATGPTVPPSFEEQERSFQQWSALLQCRIGVLREAGKRPGKMEIVAAYQVLKYLAAMSETLPLKPPGIARKAIQLIGGDARAVMSAGFLGVTASDLQQQTDNYYALSSRIVENALKQSKEFVEQTDVEAATKQCSAYEDVMVAFNAVKDDVMSNLRANAARPVLNAETNLLGCLMKPPMATREVLQSALDRAKRQRKFFLVYLARSSNREARAAMDDLNKHIDAVSNYLSQFAQIDPSPGPMP